MTTIVIKRLFHSSSKFFGTLILLKFPQPTLQNLQLKIQQSCSKFLRFTIAN